MPGERGGVVVCLFMLEAPCVIRSVRSAVQVAEERAVLVGSQGCLGFG